MALRHRMTLLAAGTVGITVVLVAAVAYAVLRADLRSQVDDGLTAQATRVQRVAQRARLGLPLPGAAARAGRPGGAAQVLNRAGQVVASTPSDLLVPVDADDRAVAAGSHSAVLRDRSVAGLDVRVLTVPLRRGGAVQIASSLAAVNSTLSSLRLVLVLLCAAGTLLAALLGRLFGSRVIRPVAELTAAAEHIGATEDLGRRIDVQGHDEVGRMAARFNAMLDTLARSRRQLDESVHAQRQLVADASHELRTPVTSLRTNIEVLLAGGDMAAEERDALLRSVRAQAEELSALITDVIELARGDEPLADIEEIRLDTLVTEAVERAGRLRPEARFLTTTQPTVISGQPERIGRAVANLLDNAAKHGAADALVEVEVHPGELVVRDHGPGIPVTERDRVFERFFRGAGARRSPGSGLGLAIVRQVAEAHGGTVAVEETPGGGASFRLRLPVAG